MDLGAFSVSLAVKDLAASRDFYAKLGFEVIGGAKEHSYLIMANGGAVIGLFEGMFDRNILTFNPGLTAQGEKLDEFTDVRRVQAVLEQKGIRLTERADEEGEGAAHIAFVDPDGNPILIDQFF